MGLENKRVSEILDEVERGEIALPEIQREFVWKPHQIRDLVDTIYRNYPAGMLIFWEKPYGENIPYELIDEDAPTGSKSGTSGEYKSLVIDGQQRITALLKVRRGDKYAAVYFNPLKEEFRLESSKVRDNPLWFPVSDVVDPNKSLLTMMDKKKPALKKKGLSNAEINKIMRRLEELRNRFSNYVFPVYKIPSNFTYEQVTEIFSRINYKGTRLKTTDLVLAIFSIRAPVQFKRELRGLMDYLSSEGWDLDASVVIRSLIAVAKGEGNLTNFRRSGMKISKKDLMDALKKTKESMSQLIDILKEIGVDSSDLLPSGNVIPPMVTYLASKNGDITDREKNLLILWFILASFWGRYTGATDTRLGEDVREAKNGNLGKLFEHLKMQVGRLEIDSETFVERSYGNEFLLYLICYRNRAVDWFQGIRIKSNFHKHHIFPRSLLKKTLGKNELNLINHIGNIAFLMERANKRIKDKKPEDYLKEIKEIDKERLKQQFIPLDEELWKLENYKSFLEERTRMVVDALNSWFNDLGLKEIVKSKRT